MAYLQQENQKLEELQKKMKEKLKQIKRVQRKVENGENMKKLALTIAESEDITNNFQKKLRSFQSHSNREEKIRLKIHKIFKTTKEKMFVMQKAMKELEEEEDDEDSGDDDENDEDDDDDEDTADRSIEERSPVSKNITIEITIDSLVSPNVEVQQLINQGGIQVVRQFQGNRKYAKLAIHDSKYLCLHHLTDELALPDAKLLQYEDVMQLASPSSRLIFLELKSLTSKSILGKIYIKLISKTLRGRNFLLMCTGEAGPSYSNTNILSVNDQGCQEEFVWSGDYEQNDGFGGRALVTGAGNEVGSALKKPWVAGTVAGGSLVDAFAAHFLIYTRNCPGKVLDQWFPTGVPRH